MDKLKEYIKQLAREVMSEESATGAIGVGAGPIMTPAAFAPKGQKKNAATKYAEKEGWKQAKGMPKHSKMLDYKELWPGKKSAMNENIEDLAKQTKEALKKLGRETNYLYEKPSNDWNEYDISNAKSILSKIKKLKEYSNYDKPSTFGAASGYTAPSGYTGPSSASKGGGYYATDVKETMEQMVKEELLNEVTYSKFKNEVKFRTKNEQLHKAIREVKRKLSEIDRIVEYTSRMKQELSEGEEGLKYWKNTEKNIATISEMVNQLNNKIKNLHQ